MATARSHRPTTRGVLRTPRFLRSPAVAEGGRDTATAEQNLERYLRLQNGSDIRGVALEGCAFEAGRIGECASEDEPMTLSVAEAFHIGAGFADWLRSECSSGRKECTVFLRVAIGRDPRLSGEPIVDAILGGLASRGVDTVDMGLATTPACFMSTIEKGYMYDGALMCTASHLPWNRNGIKFFTKTGGLKKPDITSILTFAAEHCAESPYEDFTWDGLSRPVKLDFMPTYAAHLRHLIMEGVDHPASFSQPLKGMKVVVDAGNGSGGFFKSLVMEPLGANTTGSQFLEPDGNFPNHVPNPEDAEAMASATAAVLGAKADLGVVFDTDVDRSGMVDSTGLEINKNRLIALLASIVLKDNPGATIVTDSVTNLGLSDFIKAKGGKHVRYKRGYQNVIQKGIELNEAGIDTPLMIETSGHGAMRDNFFLDDGAYLAVQVVKALVLARLAGKGSLSELLEGYTEALEGKEIRLALPRDTMAAEGAKALAAFKEFIPTVAGWEMEAENFEGWRVNVDEGEGKRGWLLLRQSLHDPLLVLNVESDTAGGCALMVAIVAAWFKTQPQLQVDASKLEA